jgi:hypothetical protein
MFKQRVNIFITWPYFNVTVYYIHYILTLVLRDTPSQEGWYESIFSSFGLVIV